MAKSLLGKGQIYLPREGFKKAYSWAEGVVTKQGEKVCDGIRDMIVRGDIDADLISLHLYQSFELCPSVPQAKLHENV